PPKTTIAETSSVTISSSPPCKRCSSSRTTRRALPWCNARLRVGASASSEQACRRGELTYELSLADVMFPHGSPAASLVARYRTWLGLAPFAEPEAARPPKVDHDDIVVGSPIDLVVLACKTNAL